MKGIEMSRKNLVPTSLIILAFAAALTACRPAQTVERQTNDAAIEALKNKQIDGIVVDLPTADFITNVQLDGSVIVGTLDQGAPEHFSAVLAKGSPLTSCVNAAIKALTDDGTLMTLTTKWLPFSGTPALKP